MKVCIGIIHIQKVGIVKGMRDAQLSESVREIPIGAHVLYRKGTLLECMLLRYVCVYDVGVSVRASGSCSVIIFSMDIIEWTSLYVCASDHMNT